MRKWSEVAPEDIYIGLQEELLHGEGGQTLEQAVQRSGRVAIPGGI